MNYEDTKRAMMASYPRLFIDDTDIVNHLFFVIGNGYEWENGQLVSGDGSVEEQIKFARDDYKRFLEERINWEKQFFEREKDEFGLNYHSFNYYQEELKRMDDPNYIANEQARELVWRKEQIADGMAGDTWLLNDDGSVCRKIYPLCQYSHILSIPDDVADDWFEAAKKAFSMAKNPLLFKLTDSDIEWLNKAELRIAELENKR